MDESRRSQVDGDIKNIVIPINDLSPMTGGQNFNDSHTCPK